MLLGGGLGLVLGGYLPGVPLQAPVISTLAITAMLLRAPRATWAAPLALSLLLSLSMLNVRTASALLYLLVTAPDAAPPLLAALRVPESFYANSMLILLGAVYILLVGAALVQDGLTSMLSPLWEGFEALPTPSKAALRLRRRGLVTGLPIGVAAAILDRVENSYTAFALLVAGSSSTATLATLAVNLPLAQLLRLTLGARALSVALGVQAGVLVSTMLMATLLYVKHGARSYSCAGPNAAAVLVGLLMLLLSFTALLGPASAASAVALTAATAIVANLIAVRLEGELYVLTLTPSAYPPQLLWAAWWGIVGLIGLDARLAATTVNPSSMALLALATVWGYKLSACGTRPTPLLAPALAMPALLTLARGVAAPERWRPSSYMYLDSVRALVSPSQLPVIDIPLVIAATSMTAVVCTLTYYLAPPDSGLRLVGIVATPGGLLAAYSDVFPPTPSLWIALAVLAALRYAELRLHSDHLRQAMYGGLSTYGALLAVLAVLSIT